MSTIAIDARELRTTTGRYVERLLYYLQALDQQHQYIVLLKPQDIDGWVPSNPNFKKLVCPHKEFTFDEQTGFKRQLEALRPDLVHFPMVQQPVRYRGKTVTTMNDLTTIRFKNPSKNKLVFSFKQQVYKWVNKRVARKADALFTYSQFVKDDVVNFTGADPTKITVTSLAADPITVLPDPVDSLMHKRFIMYLGRPLPHKNLWRLVEAFQILQQRHPELYLALAGRQDAVYQQIEQRVASSGIPNVVFTDFISDKQLRWMYEHCDAYVFPSLSEGFGLPGLEAMQQGAPVVSSKATCLPEIYGDAACYFDPNNVQDMADTIDKVLGDKQLRQTLIVAGKQQAVQYSWQRTAEQTLAVYNRVLGEG